LRIHCAETVALTAIEASFLLPSSGSRNGRNPFWLNQQVSRSLSGFFVRIIIAGYLKAPAGISIICQPSGCLLNPDLIPVFDQLKSAFAPKLLK